jgi:hypothetical protein
VINKRLDCLGQQPQIAFLPDLNRAKRLQMVGHELAIEQAVAPHLHPRHQPC